MNDIGATLGTALGGFIKSNPEDWWAAVLALIVIFCLWWALR